MKKAFAVFALCLVLAAGGLVLCNTMLHQDRDQVAVTAATLSGDPAAAEGLVATQAAHLDDQLRWDLTIPLAHPEAATTRFDPRYAPEDPGTSRPTLGIDTPMNTNYGFSGGMPLEELTEFDRQLYLLKPLLEDVLSRAPKGKTYSETVSLGDYYETYPLHAEVYGLGGTFFDWEAQTQDLDQGLQAYFSFPVPEETRCTVTVETDEDGDILNLDVSDPDYTFGLDILSVGLDDAILFVFSQYTTADFSNTPGGCGLYRLPLPQQSEASLNRGGTLLPDPAELETVYPLPEGARVLNLTLDQAETALLLTYCLGTDYRCLVLDPETMVLRQTLEIPAEDVVTLNPTEDGTFEVDSSPGIYETLPGENFLLFYGSESFHLFSLDGGTYTYAFSAPMEQHLYAIYHGYLTGAWNGETLALATPRDEDYCIVTGLTLSLFRQGELVYQGRYDTSLDSGPGQASPNNYQDRIQLVYDQELALHWE